MLTLPSVRQSIQFLLLGDFLLLPFAHFKVSFWGLPLYALEIPILIAFFLFILGYFRHSSEWTIRIPKDSGIFIGIILFLCGATLSFIANPFSWTSLGMMKTWFIIPLLAAFLWLQVNRDTTKYLFMSWALSSLCIALGGLWFLVHDMLTYDSRLEAWYTSPNFLAILIAPGIIIVSFLFEYLRSQQRLDRFSLLLICAAMFALSIVLFHTHSYTVWVATFFSLLFFIFSSAIRKKSLKTILLVSVLIILSSLFVFFESGTAKWNALISFEERSSLASRMMIWQTAWKITTDHPFVGIGVGRFQEEYLFYQKYFPPYLEWAVPEPHNLFLAVWLETGFIGLLGSILIVLRLLTVLFRNTFSQHIDENKRMSARLILSLLLLFLVYGLADTPYFKNDLSFLFWMLLAAAISLIDQSDKDAS